MDLSVIIPCYNAADTIAVQLDALVRQEWPGSWEIIIANNKSTDASMTIVQRYKDQFPSLRVVDASSRQGPAYATNTAAHVASGEALAFCDADDEVESGWVATMGQALQQYDFVSCRIDTQKLNPWMRQSRRSPQEFGLQRLWYPPYLLHAGRGTLGVKRVLFERVGGFDETLLCCEDTDFCLKLQQRGIQLHFVVDAVVHIRYRRTLSGVFLQSRNYAEYNVLISKKYRTDISKKNYYTVKCWKLYFTDWWQVIRHLPSLRNTHSRYWWMWHFGRQVGRLRGSIKYRTPPV
jgi:glycosyltransferase involved in cell wall biosynthesis